ncbi:polycystin-2 [Trichonephila clavipes]|uniref:Polycystin-2 n=1 Tax=Trichonephila clavipes TaxID=2585209 RepID=A0A8X6W118_TRICX|nr:polycystin-2 [Trichonephila clavipes]
MGWAISLYIPIHNTRVSGFNMAGRDTTKRRRPSVADDEIGEAWGGVTKDNDDEGIMVDDLYIQADETDIVPEKERSGCWHGCMRSIKATRPPNGRRAARPIGRVPLPSQIAFLPIPKTRRKLARPLAGKPSAIGRTSHSK